MGLSCGSKKISVMDWISFLKALHVVGFVSWFAGLFYLVRLFVYHVEAGELPEVERRVLVPQYTLMEQRLYRIITHPAMLISWLAGLGMLAVDLSGLQERAYFSSGAPGWMHLKLVFLVLLTAYHLYCKRIMLGLAAGRSPFSAWQFRLFNEAPTFFLAAISFTAVYGKNGTLNYGYLALGLGAFSALVYAGARAYKKRREGSEE